MIVKMCNVLCRIYDYRNRAPYFTEMHCGLAILEAHQDILGEPYVYACTYNYRATCYVGRSLGFLNEKQVYYLRTRDKAHGYQSYWNAESRCYSKQSTAPRVLVMYRLDQALRSFQKVFRQYKRFVPVRGSNAGGADWCTRLEE